jgi:hypothetical protein
MTTAQFLKHVGYAIGPWKVTQPGPVTYHEFLAILAYFDRLRNENG